MEIPPKGPAPQTIHVQGARQAFPFAKDENRFAISIDRSAIVIARGLRYLAGVRIDYAHLIGTRSSAG